jgi:hypothetical protein
MNIAAKSQPFFIPDNDTFIPTPVADGPWDTKSMHGRVIVGLLAHVIEQRHSGPEFVPARLTVDMFRLPNIMTPVEVKTKLVRDGLRIRVVEADFLSAACRWRAPLRSCCAGQKIRKGRCGRRRTGTCRSHRTFRPQPIRGSA